MDEKRQLLSARVGLKEHWHGQWHPFVGRSLSAAAVMLTAGSVIAGPVATFDDIQFWVGSGANQSALAIDWDGQSVTDHALVWGYRWDGMAKGIDMVTAIVSADDRLYAKIGPISGFGIAVVGIGYDANHDGQFLLNSGTVFDEHGISGDVPSDGDYSLGAEDWYAEGWFDFDYWSYGVAASSPFDGGSWSRSGSGISSRNLMNGSWDSLAITPINTQSYAQNPLAAEPFGDADFDDNGTVDGQDFLTWQRGFGTSIAQPSDGDANGDGTVDSADLAFWSAQYGTAVFSGFTSDALEGVAFVVPEPTSLVCVCIAAGTWPVGYSRFRFASWRTNS